MMVRRTWSSWSEEVSALPSSWNTATSPTSRCPTAGLRRLSTPVKLLGCSTLRLDLESSFEVARHASPESGRRGGLKGQPNYKQRPSRGATRSSVEGFVNIPEPPAPAANPDRPDRLT